MSLKRGTVRQIRRQKFNGKTYDYPYHIYSYEAGQNYFILNATNGLVVLVYITAQSVFLQLADQ
nr:hypothetical protein [Lactobacillus helveticus]